MDVTVPPLPKIEGEVDIILDIYAHDSLKGNYTPNEEYGDTNRLAQLGAVVLEMVLTNHLFHKRPILSAQEISDHTKNAISDNNIREWLTAYNIAPKFHAAPGMPGLMDSPDEMRKFFHAYIGALYIRNGHPNGLNQVQAWISALVDPNADMNSFAIPPAPLGMPPPLPQNNQSSPPQNPLSAMNEISMKKNISVTYPAIQTGGPSHAPTWSVGCFIDGVERGRGTGKSQKLAKEEAARQAYPALQALAASK